MKKVCILLIIILCLLVIGCNNQFAENEYDSLIDIAKNEDRFAKESSVFNPIDGGYSLVVSKFDGRQTLWTGNLQGSQNVEVEISFSLTQGTAKIVHIDADDNVSTLIECTPESSTDGYVTKTVSMTGGRNRIKIVGFDCENVNLKILIPIE